MALNASAKKDSDRQLREAVVKLKVAGLHLGKIDPFQGRKVKAPKKHSAVTVKLNGGLFVSEKTRKALNNALNDGYQLIKPQPALAAAVAPVAAVKTVELPKPVRRLAPAPALQRPFPPAGPCAGPAASRWLRQPGVMNAVEQAMARLQAQQSETTHVHEQYLTNDAEYGRIFSQVTQMGVSLVSNPNANSQQIEQALSALQSIERSMMRFHDHQAETLKVHEQYLKGQEEFSGQYVQPGPGPVRGAEGQSCDSCSGPVRAYAPPVALRLSAPAPVQKPLEEVRKVTPAVNVTPAPAAVEAPKNGNGNGTKPPLAPQPAPAVQKPAPAPVPAAPAAGSPDYAKALLGMVSEKTGYPPEMLDLSMDMEADLGIDSIKRVEIVGALREIFPLLPKMEADTFGEIRSLGQIIDYMQQTLGQSARRQPPLRLPVAAPAPALRSLLPQPRLSRASHRRDSSSAVAGALLSVVSEKTGYPPEMLDHGYGYGSRPGDRLDQTGRNPGRDARGVPGPAQGSPGRLRRDAQPAPGDRAHHARAAGRVQRCQQPRQLRPAVQAGSPAGQRNLPRRPLPQASPSGFDVDALAKGLLSVVSEKTGYPPEMLDLGMDMEADLGIDSIKKVEIMGAMRQIDPSLPKADPEAFAEARTLGQVVTYLGTLSGKTASEASAAPF